MAGTTSNRRLLVNLAFAVAVVGALWLYLRGSSGPIQPNPQVEALPWIEDYELALSRADEAGKAVMIDFTGSDWCGYCKALGDQVFATDEFRAWSRQNVVLLRVDFPRFTEQPRDVAERNSILARRYGITGFPTIVFVDGDGRPLGVTGFMEGGPDAWIAEAERIIAAGRGPG